MKALLARGPLVLSVLTALVALTITLASVIAGALAAQSDGSAATVARSAGVVTGVASTEKDAAPALPAVPVAAAEALPQPAYADWQINEMTARHPEP